MTLIKTSVLNAIAVAIRVLSSIALNKIIAIYVGPSGYALIGQFQNLVTMLTTFANGGMNTGVTKGTAEHYDDTERQQRLWRTAGTITVSSASVVGLLIIMFSPAISRHVLNDEHFWGIFVWLGLSLVLIALNGLLLAILNGKKQIKLFVAINIVGSLVGLAVTGMLTILLGLKGALIALSVNQALVFFVSAFACLRQPWFRVSMLIGTIDSHALRELLKFTAMTLTSAIVVPLTQILIRNHLIDRFGMANAGYWEALSRISGLYLTVITVPLSIYYLPRLAEIRSADEMRREILSGYRLILPTTVIGAATIYFIRDIIIGILFTRDFVPMRALFGWQVVGDVFKISGWLFGYVLIARGMAKSFIATEIMFGALWYGLVLVLTRTNGLVGAQMAYALNYLAYAAVLAVLLAFNFKRWNGHEGSASRRI